MYFMCMGNVPIFRNVYSESNKYANSVFKKFLYLLIQKKEPYIKINSVRNVLGLSICGHGNKATRRTD